jgi:hypothetical protein
MTIYEILLFLHSITRWLVLVFGIYAIARGFIGWTGRKDWKKLDKTSGMLFASFLDLQLLFGLILYFISPITSAGLRNFSGAMKVADVRFFLVEHSLIMVVAVILAHIGSARVKKAATDLQKHRQAALWYLGALVLILTFIPWNRLFS